MNVQKLKQVQQSNTKVYNCTFQLHLYELMIFLKFPCKFFIEWKISNGTKSVRTQSLVEFIKGEVKFNQNLLIETQMLYNINQNEWLKKNSTINVYLITKNKPDFNQLAGRINIDLSLAMQNNPYKQVITQSLTNASTSADLKFSLETKYSLQSQKSLRQVDLLEFSDRLFYVGKGKENISKSKSMGYLKTNHSMISPVYRLNTISQVQVPKIQEQHIQLQFPKMKLQNFGHDVFQSVEMQPKNKNDKYDEFNVRMTLGTAKKNISRQDYELMIDEQTKGMKKSDLMAVPNMKKSKIEEHDSSFNTERTKKESEQEFIVGEKQQKKQRTLQKTGSQTRCQLPRVQSKQSQIEINFDNAEAQALLYSRQLYQNASKDINIVNGMIMNSIKSSSSFSISQFKAQFQNADIKNLNEPKDQNRLRNTFGFEKKENVVKSMQRKQIFNNRNQGEKYQLALNQVRKLQIDISELTVHLTEYKQKSEILQLTLRQARNQILRLQQENRFQKSKIRQFQQKAEYESKINMINCEKLKKVSSELTVERSRIRMSENSLTQTQIDKLKIELKKLTQQNRKLSSQNESLKMKLQQRDEIELQNQIRIQELQELLEKQKDKIINLSNHKNQDRLNKNFSQNQATKQTLGTESAKQEPALKFQLQKLQKTVKELQQLNYKLQTSLSDQNTRIEQKAKKLQAQLAIVQKQSHQLIIQLVNKQKLLSEKTNEVELWKTKSYSITFSSSAQNQLKQKALEEDLKLKSSLISSYKYEIQQLEKQIQTLTLQNQQLTQFYNKIMRESYRFQGELKVIKQEQILKQSFGSSGEIFRLPLNHGLTVREQSTLTFFKQAIDMYNQKLKKSQKVEIQFFNDQNDIRRKIFCQLQTAINVIKELLKLITHLQNEKIKQKESKQKTQHECKLKLQFLQGKINSFEENQKTKPSSSYIIPFLGAKNEQNQKIDQLSSKVTKKKSLLETISSQTKLSRQVQKLKSILEDKNKEISDLIASYQRLKLQKETQSMLIKSKKIKFQENQIPEQDYEDQSDAYLVHDILDLQIRLNKQKEKKNLVMEELELRKSLNRSQQLSQNIPHFDLSSVYQEIRAIITSRENYITTENTLKKMVEKINQLNEQSNNQEKERSYKLTYLAEEKSRLLSKQFQKMKSALLKLNLRAIDTFQCKTFIANAFKPTQKITDQLISLIEQLARYDQE